MCFQGLPSGFPRSVDNNVDTLADDNNHGDIAVEGRYSLRQRPTPCSQSNRCEGRRPGQALAPDGFPMRLTDRHPVLIMQTKPLSTDLELLVGMHSL